jgi:hypothetical protein
VTAHWYSDATNRQDVDPPVKEIGIPKNALKVNRATPANRDTDRWCAKRRRRSLDWATSLLSCSILIIPQTVEFSKKLGDGNMPQARDHNVTATGTVTVDEAVAVSPFASATVKVTV